MQDILNDGYYIPKDPENFKKWYENATYKEKLPNIPTVAQLAEYQEATSILKKICVMLKCSPDKVTDKFNELKTQVEDLGNTNYNKEV